MKKAVKIIGWLILAVILVVLVYVGYIWFSYYRIPDNQSIEADAPYRAEALVKPFLEAGQKHTILTMNLGFGAYDHTFDFFMDGGKQSWGKDEQTVHDNIQGSIRKLLEEKADIMLLQEVDTDSTRSYHIDQRNQICEMAEDYMTAFAVNYHSGFLFWPLYQPHGNSNSGIMTASKYQITDVLRRSLPISNGFGKLLDLDRCYSVSRIPVEGEKELVLLNVHLSAYGADESIMSSQREMLYEDIVKEYKKGNYVIVGGDFNHDLLGCSNEYFQNEVQESESWAKKFPTETIPEHFTLGTQAANAAGVQMAGTCRDSGKKYEGHVDRWILDGFIYSDNVEMLDYNTIDLDFMYSDHNPVKMTFRLK